MDEIASSNHVLLCGIAAGEPLFSHENRAERFYTFPLEVERLSGAVDRLNIILRESLLPGDRRSPAVLGSAHRNRPSQASRPCVRDSTRQI